MSQNSFDSSDREFSDSSDQDRNRGSDGSDRDIDEEELNHYNNSVDTLFHLDNDDTMILTEEEFDSLWDIAGSWWNIHDRINQYPETSKYRKTIKYKLISSGSCTCVKAVGPTWGEWKIDVYNSNCSSTKENPFGYTSFTRSCYRGGCSGSNKKKIRWNATSSDYRSRDRKCTLEEQSRCSNRSSPVSRLLKTHIDKAKEQLGFSNKDFRVQANVIDLFVILCTLVTITFFDYGYNQSTKCGRTTIMLRDYKDFLKKVSSKPPDKPSNKLCTMSWTKT
eukprot:Pgem_evm2s28